MDASLRFAVVDVETSGLDVQRHRLLQIGVVVIDGQGVVLDRWSSLVRPRQRWFYRVGPTELHGITHRAVRTAPPAAEVLVRLAQSLDGAIFVAHNASFDLAFLRQAAADADVHLPIAATLCTLQLSRRLDPDRRLSHRLGEICQRYGIDLVRPHDALADADATAVVLTHLLAAHGIDTAEQVEAQLEAA
jgi:DNA polymerase-3 subunit epsilon